MPLFTLHSERHILNVIGWMESLLGRDGIAQLGQLESALCILVAYTHDLGMTLDDRECAELPTDPGYLRHRDRFLVERHLIDRLRAEGDHGRANIIENHLRTDYLRVTHADGPATRMRNRLQQIAPKLEYSNALARHRYASRPNFVSDRLAQGEAR